MATSLDVGSSAQVVASEPAFWGRELASFVVGFVATNDRGPGRALAGVAPRRRLARR